jgi:hypothetical protein
MFSANRFLFLTIGLSLFLYLIVVILSNNNVDTGVFIWQFFTLIAFLFSFKIARKIEGRGLYVYLFLYQVVLSFILHYFYKLYVGTPYGFNAVDSILYSQIAQQISDLNFKDSLRVIGSYFDDLSDYGFPLFIKYIYYITNGSQDSALKILIFLNCFFQTMVCYLTYKIALPMVGNDTSKLIVLLWGLNTASIYVNASGLKEPLFLFLCMASMYYIYLSKQKKNLKNLFFTTLFILSTWLFRYYVTIFLAIIAFGYLQFSTIYKKYFSLFCVIAIVLCLVLTDVLVNYMPEIYYSLRRTEDTYSNAGGLFKYISYVLAFLSPIPKFTNMETPQMLIMIMYSIIKYFFSVFAIIGIYYMIKFKKTEFYPLISIYLFHVLLLIVSGHTIEYRYSYVIMPCFFILMIEGFKYQRKLITYMYLVFSIMIILFFNLKMY